MIDSITYKKGNKLRFLLWGMAVVLIVVLTVFFANLISVEASAVVPDGYRFAVTNNYIEGNGLRTTYYVYDGKILVEDENKKDDGLDRVVMIYDGVDTANLVLDNEKIEICELGSCDEHPKVLKRIKEMLAGRIGREYIRF